MRSTDRHWKKDRDASVEGGRRSEAADGYIDQVLRQDRNRLTNKHNPERAKARAMGVLAASAMPASESASASWSAKIFSAKGLTGTLTVIVAIGGVTLSALFFSDSAEEKHPAPQTANRQIELAPVVEPAVGPVSQSSTRVEGKKPMEGVSTPIGANNRDAEDHGREGAINPEKMNGAEAKKEGPSGIPTPATTEEQGTMQPEVQHRSSVKTTVTIDPLVVRKK